MSRIFPLVFLALLLGSCATPSTSDFDSAASPPQLAALGPLPRLDAPRLEADRFIAADGSPLPLRVWTPSGQPRAVILALHGFNDYSNAFAGPAPSWAKAGIATYAYDQRGFGLAPGRGRWAGSRRLAEDAATAVALLHRRYPGTPIYLLGESMGGAVAILTASGASGAPVPQTQGVILVAPAVWGRQTMNIAERIGLWLARLMPSMKLDPDLIPIHIQPSDNIPMLRAYSADPLIIKDTRADAVRGLVDLMSAALSAAPFFDAPSLLLYGERDQIVPREPVARFVAGLPRRSQARQRVALYPHGYHMLLRDLDGPELVADVAAWIADPSAPLPSHADRGARARLGGEDASAGQTAED